MTFRLQSESCIKLRQNPGNNCVQVSESRVHGLSLLQEIRKNVCESFATLNNSKSLVCSIFCLNFMQFSDWNLKVKQIFIKVTNFFTHSAINFTSRKKNLILDLKIRKQISAHPQQNQMPAISCLFIIFRNASNNTACINHEFEFDKLNQIKWTIDFHLNHQWWFIGVYIQITEHYILWVRLSRFWNKFLKK